MIKDITIVFSGYNIKYVAVLAIESFLSIYPKLRENIVYFDDDSTDGTREELERRNIKVITWSNYMRNKFNKKIQENSFKGDTHYLVSRVAHITKDILLQCKTKYILVCDGDVAFLKNGFLERHIDLLKSGNRIVAHLEQSASDKMNLDIAKKTPLYNRFAKFLKYDENLNLYFTPRVHFMYALLDIEYFKTINIVGDEIDGDVFESMIGGIVDVGSDFYYKIHELNISSYWIDTEEIFDFMIHFGWLSSSNRKISQANSNNNRNISGELKNKIYKYKLDEFSRKIGVHPVKILSHYEKTKNRFD